MYIPTAQSKNQYPSSVMRKTRLPRVTQRVDLMRTRRGTRPGSENPPLGGGEAKASLNMAARQKPGADLMETVGWGRTLSSPPRERPHSRPRSAAKGRRRPLHASSPRAARATRDVLPRAAQPGTPQPGREGALPAAVPFALPWPATALAPRPGRCRYR